MEKLNAISEFIRIKIIILYKKTHFRSYKVLMSQIWKKKTQFRSLLGIIVKNLKFFPILCCIYEYNTIYCIYVIWKETPLLSVTP